MRMTDAWQIQGIETGNFLQTQPYSGENGHADGLLLWFTNDPFEAGAWLKAHCERFLALPDCPINAPLMRIVPAPQCGCCGERKGIRLLVNHPDPSHQIWRCNAHLDRLPCTIAGCGRTFKMEADESYFVSTCCGRHWRSAPKRMRDAVSRVRRIAKRRGWSRAMRSRHSRLWWRCIHEIERMAGGGLDMSAIEREFGIDLRSEA